MASLFLSATFISFLLFVFIFLNFCFVYSGGRWQLCQKSSFFTLTPISSVLSITGRKRKKRFSENVNFPLLQAPSKCSVVCPLNSMLYYKFQNIAILTYCTFCVCIIITFSFFPVLLPLHIYMCVYIYIYMYIYKVYKYIYSYIYKVYI